MFGYRVKKLICGRVFKSSRNFPAVTKATKASFQFIGDFELKAEEWTVVLDELRNALMTRSASVEHSRSPHATSY